MQSTLQVPTRVTPKITPNNVILIFNICLRLTINNDTSITALRVPYLAFWKNQYQNNTGLNFEEEITKMVPKLKRANAIHFDHETEQWEIYNTKSFDTIFIEMLKELDRDYNDVFSLAGYELSEEIISDIMEIYQEELNRNGINIFDDTE